MRSTKRPQWWVPVAVLVLLHASSSLGATPSNRLNRRQAAKLAGEALDLFGAGDYEAALDRFTRADGLYPAPTLKVRVARSLDKLDRMHDAAKKYRECIVFEVAANAPSQALQQQARAQAVTELAALLKQIPAAVMVVRGAPHAKITARRVDGTLEQEVSGSEQKLDPGRYVFRATADRRTVTRSVLLKRGDRVNIMFHLPVAHTSHAAEAPADNPWLPVGWTGVALGGALLSMGSITGLSVLAQEDDLAARCPNRTCSPAEHADAEAFDRLRVASGVGFVVGSVFFAAGLSVVVLTTTEGPDKGSVLQPVATWKTFVGPGHIGIGGQF